MAENFVDTSRKLRKIFKKKILNIAFSGKVREYARYMHLNIFIRKSSEETMKKFLENILGSFVNITLSLKKKKNMNF